MHAVLIASDQKEVVLLVSANFLSLKTIYALIIIMFFFYIGGFVHSLLEANSHQGQFCWGGGGGGGGGGEVTEPHFKVIG